MAGLLGLVEYAASDDEAQNSDSQHETALHAGGGVVLINSNDAITNDLEEAEGPEGPPDAPSGSGMNVDEAAAGTADGEEVLSEEQQELARLEAALPPEIFNPPPGSCPEEWQRNLAHLLQRQQQTGRLISAELRKNRDYRNPYFLEKMVEFYKVEPLGTAFPKEVFDPTALPPEDTAKALLVEFQTWNAKRREERDKSGRIDFHKSASQTLLQGPAGLRVPGAVAPTTSGALQEAQKKAQQIASSLAARR